MSGTEELTRIHERIDSMAEDISTIKVSIGNGQESIAVRLAKNESQIEVVAGATKKLEGKRDKWFWATITCIGAVVVGLITKL